MDGERRFQVRVSDAKPEITYVDTQNEKPFENRGSESIPNQLAAGPSCPDGRRSPRA